MISTSSYTRLDTISMIGVAKGNAEGLAQAKAAAEEAKAKYGRDVRVVEIEAVPTETLGMVPWVYPLGYEAPGDDGTYSREVAPAADAYGVTETTEATAAEALFEEFEKWADMTPAERIRAKYLEDHDLTEESLAAMSEEDRAPILQAIKEEIARMLGTPTDDGGETTTSAEADIMAMLQG